MQPTATNWTGKQRKFIEWVATPEELREPRKFTDFTEAIGVDRSTLWRWRKLPGFYATVQEQTKKYLADTLPEALQALKNLAAMGSFNHLKLYLEMLGMYTPKSQVDYHVYVQQVVEAAERRAKDEGLDPIEVVAEAKRMMGIKG